MVCFSGDIIFYILNKNFTSLNAELKTDKIFPGVTICILDKKYEIGELIEKKVVLRRDGI